MENQIKHPQAGKIFQNLSPYVPGLSIAEIRSKYGLDRVIKLASNENPLGASPFAQEAIKYFASSVFRYPQSGNPRLAKAIAAKHDVDPSKIVIGNGSDEVIDLLIRIFAPNLDDNIVCFKPCFSIYPIQAAINGNQLKSVPLNEDFSFNFDSLLQITDKNTKIVFITTPDNPSGYCPPVSQIENFARELAQKSPAALLIIDEAYMDFTGDEKNFSLLANGILPDNTAFIRTFSKSYGLAGLRIGYGVLPGDTASFFWRARLPFSVNILAEEAAIAALDDKTFLNATIETVRKEREFLARELSALGCKVWPGLANFLMFNLPANSISARECHKMLLKRGIIIRGLYSYGLPENLRVSIGTHEENKIFIQNMREILSESIN